MSNYEGKEEWTVKRAQLEREKLDAKNIVSKYEGTLKPFRDVTDSEYKAAKSRLWQLASQISEGDHEAGRPVNPYDVMDKSELEAGLAKLTAEVNTVDYEGQMIARKDSRKLAQIMRIQTRLQAMGEGN